MSPVSRKFVIEIEVDEDRTPEPAEFDMPGENMCAMADELHTFLCDVEGLPGWVYSIPGIDPDKASFRGTS